MNTIQTPQDETGLDRALQEWHLDAPLPSNFQQQVWNRIARAEAAASASVWSRLADLVEVMLPRPKVALTYVTLLSALGVVAGSWTAHINAHRTDETLRLRYVQAIDPYVGHSLNQ